MSAMEWLLQHENDPDIDSPLPDSPNQSDEVKLEQYKHFMIWTISGFFSRTTLFMPPNKIWGIIK